ncbi:hypothetical protein APT61_12220 [Leclercia adecarboxylata]|uniref:PD-(D/E)XK nuclease domain-containing protein n=1 Tax=Leclercia adecarboxylata TaxID=83655 RepID=UPI0007448F6F|nr:hypothetical protein [Leclercia adecarboxylata]ALZ96740.1 hypothetical protein APT61_12220 [Leclercia adecarboxylata]HBU94985.1 hypothetical protein [Leclercia adecarboxylata]
MDYIEKRINSLLAEAAVLEAKLGESEQRYDERIANNPNVDVQFELMEDILLLRKSFEWTLESLYLSTLAYLDERNLNHCVGVFLKMFGEDVTCLKNTDEFETGEDFREPQNVFLAKLNVFLSSFEFTESVWEKRKRIAGLVYLKRILKNTHLITARMESPPKTETEVYNAVKDTLTVIFNDIKTPKSNFLKSFKEYKPDILIPELFAAVEYKYASTEEKLKSTIEQIAADVKGYTGDNDYSIFYAVFYVTTDFWGLEKFRNVWKENKFPNNWIPIYVVGK